MSRILCLCLVLFTALLSMGVKGCESTPPPPPPKPEIVVESIESTNNTGATLYFDNHQYDQSNRKIWIRLGNPQEIKDYKAQLEFTLRRLEDIERRMTVHEDSQPDSTAVPENATSTKHDLYPQPSTP